jgi:hypothetical protein
MPLAPPSRRTGRAFTPARTAVRLALVAGLALLTLGLALHLASRAQPQRPAPAPLLAATTSPSAGPLVAAAASARSVLVPPEPFPAEAHASPRGADPRQVWLERFAACDFAAALAWAREQDQPRRDWALCALAHLLARTDPAAALRLCETEQLAAREPGHVAVVFQHYAAVFPERALEWAAALPPGRLRDLAADALFVATAEHAPEIAGMLALHGSECDPAAFAGLLTRWAQIAPARAGDWIASRAGAPWAGDALEALVATWASVEHEPAAAWIATLPPGPPHERASAAFARHRPAAPPLSPPTR